VRRFAEEQRRGTMSLAPDAVAAIEAHGWPGNVRELENVIERAVVLSSGPEISMDLLPESLMGRGSPLSLHDTPSDASLFEIVEDVERRVITDMLERCNWNQTEAAERFHVPLSTLNQKIRRLNIEIRKKGRG
jgi:DNA-binding NtrC family response regulator